MSSDDGDGKPPNPFATPSPGAANPFDDIMGTSPGKPPSPFTFTPLPPEHAAPAPTPAPAAPAPAADDMMEMLGLDTAERAPPEPPKKRTRPELEEWKQEAPALGTAGPPPDLAHVSSPRIKALPAPKKSVLPKIAAAAVLIVLIAVGVSLGQRYLKKGEEDAAAGPVLSQSDQLLQLGIRPENAPDCWLRDQGFQFSYVDSGGKDVVVGSIADVPILYRSGAKCLPKK